MIKSQDPNAVQKLTAKIDAQEKHHQLMLTVNKIVRNEDTPEAEKVAKLLKLGLTEDEALQRVKRNIFGTLGFCSYDLQSSRQEIARLKERIKDVEFVQTREAFAFEGESYRYLEDDDRHQFIFNTRPDLRTIRQLKRRAFKWSPRRNAWVRIISASSPAAVLSVRAFLDATEQENATQKASSP